jgi:hypothetical protein
MMRVTSNEVLFFLGSRYPQLGYQNRPWNYPEVVIRSRHLRAGSSPDNGGVTTGSGSFREEGLPGANLLSASPC